MRKLIYFLMVLTSLGMSSCISDPVFPDPGFEIEEQAAAVRRDTADTYPVKMLMNVPNGVQKIEVLNAVNYHLIEEILSYKDMINFSFNYEIDLHEFSRDTVLYYIFKVTDNDNRSFNRGFKLSVKRFSFPEIQLVGGKSLNVVVPFFHLKGIVSTGMKELESVRVLFKGVEKFKYTAPADSSIYQYILSRKISFGTLYAGQDYIMQIIIQDRSNQIDTTDILVRKSEGLKRPKSIELYSYNKIKILIDLTYNELNRISKVVISYPTGSIRNYLLHYNTQGVVDTFTYKNRYDSDTYNQHGYTYLHQIFDYVEGTTQLKQIKRFDEFRADDGSVEIKVDNEVESSNFVYNEKGNVTSYYGKSATILMNYADPFETGESVFCDYWQNYRYHSILDKNRQNYTGFQPIYMPAFIEGLPPFYSFGTDPLIFNSIFFNKYVVTGSFAVDPAYKSTYLYLPSYSFETDADGNITTIIENYTYNGWDHRVNIYNFSY